MSEDFTRPGSPAWTALVENSSSVEEMREKMKSKLAADGFIQRERGYEIGSDTLTREAENAVPANSSGVSAAAAPSERRETFLQVVYPGGNSRFEVAAVSQEELDARVAQVYAMFGGKR